MQESTAFRISNAHTFKKKTLQWASQFSTICYLDSNQYTEDKYSQYDWIIAIDSMAEVKGGFDDLAIFQEENKGKWQLGYLTYDLKNEVKQLHSTKPDNINAPDLFFFCPRYLIFFKDGKVTFNRNYPEAFWLKDTIEKTQLKESISTEKIELRSKISKEKYIDTVEKIKNHIVEGDIYEMNFCKEYYAENTSISPIALFHRLNDKAKAPFSSFFKHDDIVVLCTSPERFIQKQGDKLISQPIKGTIKKGESEEENQALKTQLQNDPKERAENVMIVDLVRNDLTKSAQTGTIKVEELFEIYSFETVNQMISTIVAQAKENISNIDILKNTFPMGSMTGAPKVKTMQLIEQYEQSKRGIYSGSIGYFSPEGNFDFNVVIRTLIYNTAKKYLSLQVGGAITYDSDALKEWEETELKAKHIKDNLFR